MSSPSVLVVDDDFLLLEVITDIFEKKGLNVIAASSGEAALTLIRDQGTTLDWLFTDIHLPGLIDGWQVAAVYRSRYPRRPIVFASTGRRNDGAILPGSIFVHKPYLPADVIAVAALMYHELINFNAIQGDYVGEDTVAAEAENDNYLSRPLYS